MTRKDYIALAAAFASVDSVTDEGSNVWRELRNKVANVLNADNPNFDRDRFYNATTAVQVDR